MIKQTLTIAGSDSGGGAGIQGDLKAMSANGTFAMSVITSVTAQNTTTVTDTFDLPDRIIHSQLDAIFTDFDVAAVKTGMLSSTAIITTVCKKLREYQVTQLIVDPVMKSKSGHSLLAPHAIDSLKSDLIPMALLITPNIYEAEQLSGTTIRTVADARQAAKLIYQLGCRHVLIKGGHLLEKPATDLLYDGRFFRMYPGTFIDTTNTHGTGCTFASAITAHVARGLPIPDAVEKAKIYLTQAIQHSFSIGHGHGPTNHFYFLE